MKSPWKRGEKLPLFTLFYQNCKWKIRNVCETLIPPFPWTHPRKIWTETANNWNCSTSKEQNSVENCSIVTKLTINLDIIMINLYTYHINMCNLRKKNHERKLQIKRINLSTRDIPPSKIVRSYSKSNMT